MKTSYPIIIRRGKDFYIPYAPDFDIETQGATIEEAIDMARDAISLTGICLEDQGKPIPAPSALDAFPAKPGEIVRVADVDFEEYRASLNHQRPLRNIKNRLRDDVRTSFPATV